MFNATARMACIAVLLALGLAIGADEKPNPAAKNLNRDVPRHKEFLKRIEKSKGVGDVIFLGDSITQGWEGNGKAAWKKHFADFKPVNLGIGGDQTGHVLWRITDGKELEHLKPKAAVIMIGTNNGHTAEQVAGGIKAIIDELKKQKPHMKILLLGVFPRGGAPKDAKVAPAKNLSPKIKAINEIIAKYDDGKVVFYKDIGGKFLDKEGGLPKSIMYDYLHLTPAGYEIWATAIKEDVEKLLK
jgi:lysophospholipase L1-like esterase